MKAILLAAGRGSRLGHYTENLPKSMLQLGDKSILEHQIALLKSTGINDIVVVKGFAEEKIQVDGVRYYINNNHGHSNMVYSLFCAETEIEGDLLISYGDILYDSNVLSSILQASKADIFVIVDKLWEGYYRERFEKPFDEAESLIVDTNGRILDIGTSHPKPEDVQAQYIGLIKLSASGSRIFKDKYNSAKLKYSTKTWLRGRRFENVYMTDFLQHLIDEGVDIQSVPIKHGWLEFDTVTDYEKAKSWIISGEIEKFINFDWNR